jgi:hypothetical protein
MSKIKFALAAALVAGFASAAAADGADYTVGNFDTIAPQMRLYGDARAQYLNGRVYRDDLIIEQSVPTQWWFDRGSNVPNG